MAEVLHSAPKISSNDGVRDTFASALGDMLVEGFEAHGEIVLHVQRDRVEDALRLLRDEHAYQQLMEIAGVDFPQRAERFEVVYMLLSLTKNHRIIVKCRASEDTPVPTVTTLWPNAGWLEREVFDLYGVIFDGNTDLRRILTDYGFEGHPFRKDFPLTGYIELRYSEDQKRVVYEPVELPQDFRQFDFMSPWEGADYILPGDEKAAEAPPMPTVNKPQVTEKEGDSGADKGTNDKSGDRVETHPAKGSNGNDADAPEPTESRPGKAPRKSSAKGASAKGDKSTKPAVAKKPAAKKSAPRKRAPKKDSGKGEE